MNIGTVKYYDGKKGFGFVQAADGGKNIFIDISALDRAGLGGLDKGQRLQFDLEQDSKGRKWATNLQLV